MPDDDPFADEGPFGRPLPPDDRLWRHPSELSWTPLHDPPTAAIGSGAASRSGRLWSVALTSGLTGAVLTLGIVALVGGLGERVTERVVERVPIDEEVSAFAPKSRTNVPAIASDVGASVVRLEITTADGRVVGSGVVFRSDGTVLTNAHLVADVRAVEIVLADGTTVTGRVLGSDRLTDVAVLTVADDHGQSVSWTPATIGSAEELAVGEPAIVVGAPRDIPGVATVTAGIVSGLARRLRVDDLVLHGLIQTDAPIAEESSGGALCDDSGVVVGLTTTMTPTDDTSSEVGFAIPADVVRSVAEQLLADGGVHWAWLGIGGTDSSSGVQVVSVDEAGPAYAAGMQAGDVLIGVDGTAVRSMTALVTALRAHRPGDTIIVEVQRGDALVPVTVVLTERP